MTFPSKIKIPSDDTELELVSTDKKNNATYKYIKAIYHINSEISWSEKDFETLVRKRIIVVPSTSTQ